MVMTGGASMVKAKGKAKKRTRRPTVRGGRSAAVGVAGLAAVGFIGAAYAQPAGAIDVNCPNGAATRVSTACHYVFETAQQGALAVVPNDHLNMSLTDVHGGNHIGHALWAWGSGCGDNGPNQNEFFMEVGVTYGFEGSAEYTYYEMYSTEHLIGGIPYTFATDLGPAAVINGQNHTYAIQAGAGASGVWTPYIDGSSYFVNIYPIGDGICQSQTGLEVASNLVFPESTTSSGMFAATSLKWEDYTNTWHQGWDTSQWYTYPVCGSPPNCYNGSYFGSTEWHSSKPS